MRPLPILLLLLIPSLGALAEAEAPFEPGRTIRTIEGLKTTVLVPEGLSAEKKGSLLIALHSASEKGSGMAERVQTWVDDGYVVCAPTANQFTWEIQDVKLVKKIAEHLLERIPIDATRIHVMGYSSGGLQLAPLCFDDDLKPCSAIWVASGYAGGQIPKWAKKGLSAIVLIGSEDPEAKQARKTAPALRGRVRRVEVKEQDGLGHRFPVKLVPYLRWWMGVAEGRFEAGKDLSFDWKDDLGDAFASQRGNKRGGVMLWLYETGAEDDAHRMLQEDTFFDPDVRFLGRQLPCVRLEATETLLATYKVKTKPAIVVFDAEGAAKRMLQGPITAKKLAKALKGVVPRKKRPR